MRLTISAPALSVAVLVLWLIKAVAGQEWKATTVHQGSLPHVSQAGKTDWTLHNLDLKNSRYSPLNEINASNVSNLTLQWSFPAAPTDNIRSTTPLVVNGVMYFNAGSKLFALNAVT